MEGSAILADDVNSLATRQKPTLPSFPDLSVDGETLARRGLGGGPVYWLMPFRTTLFKESVGLGRIEPNRPTKADKSDLDVDWNNPDVYAPIADVYSYFVRRRTRPTGYAAPTPFQVAMACGGRSYRLS